MNHINNNHLQKRAGFLALFIASLLAIGKITIAFLTGSVSVLASALDSLLDSVSSAINLFAIVTASKPADHDHRFGHGKAEALAGFLQSIIIAVSGFYVLWNSINGIMYPEVAILDDVPGLYVMVLSLALTFLLVRYQSYVIKKTKSLAVSADNLHYISDLLGNAVVIVSLLLTRFTGIRIFDSVGGLFIAVWVLKSSYDILKQSLDILMDRDISDKYRDLLKEILDKHKADVLGYHDLRSRTSGQIDHLEFHLEMPSKIPLMESHEIVETIMKEIRECAPDIYVDIAIHSDPAQFNAQGQKVLLDKQEPQFY